MRLVLALGLVLAAGCGGKVIVVNGIEVYERYWNAAVDDLAPRASHDLGCPPAQLEYTLFSRHGRHPNQIGVIGCGRRATYTRPTVRGAGGSAISETWILDGAVQPMDGQAAPGQLPPPPPQDASGQLPPPPPPPPG